MCGARRAPDRRRDTTRVEWLPAHGGRLVRRGVWAVGKVKS